MKFSILMALSLALFGTHPVYARTECSLLESYKEQTLSTRTVELPAAGFKGVLQFNQAYFQHPFHSLEIETVWFPAEPIAVWLSDGSARVKYGDFAQGSTTVYPALLWDFGGTTPDAADFHYRIDIRCTRR